MQTPHTQGFFIQQFYLSRWNKENRVLVLPILCTLPISKAANKVTIQFLDQITVAVQIASDLFEYQEKARSIQVYMSTFDAGIGQIRGELNSYLIRNILVTFNNKN